MREGVHGNATAEVRLACLIQGRLEESAVINNLRIKPAVSDGRNGGFSQSTL